MIQFTPEREQFYIKKEIIMANMEQIYALQEVIRKKTKALEKDKYGFRGGFMVKTNKEVDKEDAARGVNATVSGLGVQMEFAQSENKYELSKEKKGVDLSYMYHTCKLRGVADFESVTLNPADSEIMFQLFVLGGRVTPAEFRKICEGQYRENPTLRKVLQLASPSFDMIIDDICKKNGIVLDKSKQFAQGAASLEQKMADEQSKQMAAQLHDGNTL
jgi:hypothetical protein